MCGAGFALVFAFLCLPGPSCTNSDNMALLLGTLKIMQRATCDDETVSLACPRGTAITIQVAQYGKISNGGHTCADNSRSQSISAEVEDEKDCLWPNTMQYSILQRVVEACQKKPDCKFSTKPKTGLPDPCPKTRKFVEVAYKCRPSTFRSRTCCEDDVIKLSCNPYSRIAIYGAQYGRTAYESIPLHCQQTQGIPDETCSAQHGTDTVIQICHGKRRCQIEASSKTFGTPCSSQTRTYLKVVYACVPLGVLTERYESAAESDEVLNGNNKSDDNESLFDDTDGVSDRWEESNAVSPVVNPALQPPDDVYPSTTSTQNNEVSIIKPTRKSTVDNNGSSNHKTLLFIYVSSGILIFVILILLLVAIRCYVIRRSSDNSKTGDMFTTEAPNVFNDTVSDIDNDVDVSHISGTFYDPIHPDMILYRENPANKGTLRAMRPLSTIYPCAGASMYGNVDYVPSQGRELGTSRYRKEDDPEGMLSPKSLGTYSNSQFYYG